METNIPETVCLSDTKLFKINNFLTETQCDLLIDTITQSSHNFIDRGVKSVNLGLNGERGRYDSMLLCAETFPHVWQDHFSNRSINGIPLDSVMVNRYHTGDFIPKHRDKQGSIFTVCVPLQTSQDSLIFVDDDERTTVCKDIKGVGYGFFGNKPVHYVPPVQQHIRYSLVCLYGPNTY